LVNCEAIPTATMLRRRMVGGNVRDVQQKL
jgi:hypothetical protein